MSAAGAVEPMVEPIVESNGGPRPAGAASVPRRFVIVAPNFYPRTCGIGDHSARLGQELMRRGHAVVVLSRPPVRRNPEVPQLEARSGRGTSPATVGQSIADEIERLRPSDVIIQYTAQMWDAGRFGTTAAAVVAWRARQAGANVTLIAHEPFVPWYRRPDLWLGALTQRVSFAALIKNCDQSFVTTETRLRYVTPYARALGCAESGVSRIGANALPLVRPAGARSFTAGGAGPRLGVFSTAGVGKRFDVVLDAFARVGEEFPRAELVLIGDLGPRDRPAVRDIAQRIEQHPARARIRTTGKISLARVAEEIAALDVYLFPMNTGANTRSCTLPVALGTGLPAIAIRGMETDTALFRDGETIVFATDLTGPAFAAATLALLRDPGRLARVGEGARGLFEQHLSWKQIADQLLAAI